MKEDIIEEKNSYSAKELYDFIVQGIVTYDELNNDEYYPLRWDIREELEPMIKNMGTIQLNQEKNAWNGAVAKNTISAYMNFMQQYPNSVHVADANTAISNLKVMNEWNSIDKDDIVAVENFVSNNPLFTDAKKLLDDLRWKNVNKADKNDVSKFIDKYPESAHIDEANEILNRLDIPKVDIHKIMREHKGNPDLLWNKLTKYGYTSTDVCNALEEDRNVIYSSDLKYFIDNNIISRNSAYSISGLNDFVNYIYDEYKDASKVDATYHKLDRIKDGHTAVYFWGFPSSGKTCALGSILDALGKESFIPQRSQGYDYMTSLKGLFSNNGDIFHLPSSNASDSIFDMEFLHSHGKKSYLVSCIDLAGEVLMGMKENNGAEPNPDEHPEVYNIEDPNGYQPYSSKERKMAMDTLYNIFVKNSSKNNRNIHFFVIEYGAYQRKYNGFDQTTLLEAAVTYLDSYGIFEKNADGIYIIVTKADKTNLVGDERDIAVAKYIKEKYFGFWNSLGDICNKYEINGKQKPEIFSFSIGNVCLGDLCKSDDTDAKKIVEIIRNSVYAEDTSFLGKIKNKIKK